MKTTNVRASQLNYDKYSSKKYDRDIVNSIPFHKELHMQIISYISRTLDKSKNYEVLDLGVGTGITSKIIQDLLPNAKIDVVGFSRQMLSGAKRRLGKKRVSYILGDYSKINFKKKYDIVVSVIGIHHQNDIGKRLLFKKIYSILKHKGLFIFGDLVTYKDKHEAALNTARHFHHLVEKSIDNKSLREWAYHHIYLNQLAPIEDQIKWLGEAGFKKIKVQLNKVNTALVFANS